MIIEKKKIFFISLLLILIISLTGLILTSTKTVDAKYNNAEFLSKFTAKKGAIKVVTGGIEYDLKIANYIESPKMQNDATSLSVKLKTRNTIVFYMKNESTATKIDIKFITSNSNSYDDKKKETFDIEPMSDFKTYYFNLSNNDFASGYLTGFRIMPQNTTEGKITINSISFEREDPLYNYSGKITACTTNGDTVKIEGTLDDEFQNSVIKVYRTDISNLKETIDTESIIKEFLASGKTFAVEFSLAGIDVSHFSSRFILTANGVKIDKMVGIELNREISTNPYEFTLNNLTVKASDYGAKGDGYTDDTDSIQKAIDDVSKRGGGKVILEGDTSIYKRRYVVTSINMKSRVELNIEKGSMLWQSQRPSDYKYEVIYGHDISMPGVYWSHASLCKNYPLIYGTKVNNIKISGGGEIRMADTGADNILYTDKMTGCGNRIHIIPIGLFDCVNVEISEIELSRASSYHIACYDVKNLYIGGVTLSNVADIGGDGISLGCGTNNVKIDNCDIYVTDDAVVLWSTSDGEKRGLTWWNNVIGEDHNVKNIEIQRNYIVGGHGITFITWGTDASDLSKQEISDIFIRDNILGEGNTAIAGWYDNPYYGDSRADNGFTGELDDFSPIKNITIINNQINGYATFNQIPATNVISDCDIKSSTNFANGDFERKNGKAGWTAGLSYWTKDEIEKGSCSTEKIGENTVGVVLNKASGTSKLYQGLNLRRGDYTFQAKLQNIDADGSRVFVEDGLTNKLIFEKAITSKVLETSSFNFKVEKTGTYLIGIESKTAESGKIYIDDAKLIKGAIDQPYNAFINENFEGRVSEAFDESDWEIQKTGSNTALTSPLDTPNSILAIGNANYGDIDLKFNFEFDADKNMDSGFSITLADSNFKHYEFRYNLQEESMTILKNEIKNQVVIASKNNIKLESRTNYEMLLQIKRGDIHIFIDNELLIKGKDSSSNILANGKIKILTQNLAMKIDNLSINNFSGFKDEENLYNDFFKETFEEQNLNIDSDGFKREKDGENTILTADKFNNKDLSLVNSYLSFDLETKFKLKNFGLKESEFILKIKGNDFDIEVIFNGGNNTFSINKVENKKITALKEAETLALESNKWYKLGVRFNGSKVLVYLDKVFIGQAEVENIGDFKLNFSSNEMKVYYDEIEIAKESSLELETPIILPDDSEKPQGCACNKKNGALNTIATFTLLLSLCVLLKRKV